MSAWAPKRFWLEAQVRPVSDGFTVELDGRPVKTPAKALLVVPTDALARRIAAEWDAQEKDINPLTMPFTRSVNAALDKVTHQRAEVADMVAAYADADLLCYRAAVPESLVERQAAMWDPLLNWAVETLDAPLEPREGVAHLPQDPAVLARLSVRVHAMDPFCLTAFHDLVALSGSIVLGFAALMDHMPAAEAWRLSRLDETWQAEQWGEDEEAMLVAARKESDFLHAKSFHDLSRRS